MKIVFKDQNLSNLPHKNEANYAEYSTEENMEKKKNEHSSFPLKKNMDMCFWRGREWFHPPSPSLPCMTVCVLIKRLVMWRKSQCLWRKWGRGFWKGGGRVRENLQFSLDGDRSLWSPVRMSKSLPNSVNPWDSRGVPLAINFLMNMHKDHWQKKKKKWVRKKRSLSSLIDFCPL